MINDKEQTTKKTKYCKGTQLLYVVLITVSVIAVIVLFGMIVNERIYLSNKKAPVKNVEELYAERGEVTVIERNSLEDYASYSREYSYDFNDDGKAEQVKITWDMSGKLVFDAEGFDSAEFDADILNEDRYAVSAAVIDNSIVGDGSGNEVLVLSGASYPTENVIGSVKLSVWIINVDGFEHLMDVSYSGLADEVGIMREGVVQKNMEGDSFSYDVLINQNEYIYERSRVMADLRELGIKLPYGTYGAYRIDYKRWAEEICHFIIKS